MVVLEEEAVGACLVPIEFDWVNGLLYERTAQTCLFLRWTQLCEMLVAVTWNPRRFQGFVQELELCSDASCQ